MYFFKCLIRLHLHAKLLGVILAHRYAFCNKHIGFLEAKCSN